MSHHESKLGPKIELREHDTFGPNVTVNFPGSDLHINVGQSYVEWWNESTYRDTGVMGADIEIDEDGTMRFRFQESSRVMVCDDRGIRIYDSDSEIEDSLIVDLSHDDHFAGRPPKVFDRSKNYTG